MKTISAGGLGEGEQEIIDEFQRLYFDVSVFEKGSGSGE